MKHKLAGLCLGALLLSGCTTITPEADAPTVTSSAEPSLEASSAPSAESPSEDPSLLPAASSAEATLATLAIKGRAPKTGYERELFGEAWADVDNDGCDTRNQMLQRDLTEVVLRDGCVVASGVLADPYSGALINFARDNTPGAPDTDGDGTPGHSSAVQIDHMVALSDAWQKGAQALDETTRTAFANDPLNLIASDGPLNMQKGDGDAATWLPPNKGFRCHYVARQVAVKAKYNLWVTQAEYDAIKAILAECPDEPLPTAETSAAVEVPPLTAENPMPEALDPSGDSNPIFASCQEAKAAGFGPYVAGVDPEYDGYRDGDGDGIACE